jgi:hypothetical protein
MDATVHEKLADLFRGVTPGTRVRGAVYIWRYEDFGSEQDHMYGPMVSSPKAFTEVVSAAERTTNDMHFIIDEKYVTVDNRPQIQHLALDMNSAESDGGIMHSKFFTFSNLAYPATQVPVGFPQIMSRVVAVTSANIDNEMYRAEPATSGHPQRDHGRAGGRAPSSIRREEEEVWTCAAPSTGRALPGSGEHGEDPRQQQDSGQGGGNVRA